MYILQQQCQALQFFPTEASWREAAPLMFPISEKKRTGMHTEAIHYPPSGILTAESPHIPAALRRIMSLLSGRKKTVNKERC